MWIKFWNAFVKLTGWLLQKLCFRTRIFYEDRGKQSRIIKGPAIIISNHLSLYDYAVYIFVFFSRTLRFQVAELLFRKKPLGTLLRMLGGIYVDRDARNFGFITESCDILERGGVVGIFPESRLPLPEESRPLEFKTSAAYIALAADVPVIPVFTNGSYFSRKPACVIIGAPMDVSALVDETLSDRENIANVTAAMRECVIALEKKLNEKL